MTTPRRNPEHETAFSRWVRRQPGLDSTEYQLSITDNDLWVHRFSRRIERLVAPVTPIIEHVQLLEIKTFGADVPFAQRDTFDVINLMLRRVSVRNGRRWPITIPDNRHPGRKRQVRWCGIHLVQLSTDDPDTSDRIVWDGKYDIIDKQTLLELIRFERDPDYPDRLLDTRRHHVRPRREWPLALFKDAAE
jgi:hypothetical protein